MSDVVVVGAGIVGASVAYHLARAGAGVTLLDRSLPATGATGESFGWIGRGLAGAPPEQLALRHCVIDDYRRLMDELPHVDVHWSGSLSWSAGQPVDEPGDGRLVDAVEVGALEPNLRDVPPHAVFRPDDGSVDPVALTEALLHGAREHGADVRLGALVAGLEVRSGRVTGVRTSTDHLTAEAVVLAAGADTAVLCSTLGVGLPVFSSPAILVRLRGARPGVVRTVVSNDVVEVRQTPDGDLLLALDHEGQQSYDALRRAGEQALERMKASFRGTDDATLVGVTVGARPMPADGSPVVGPLPGAAGAYVAVMHSGVTLAPTVGRLAAAELVDGREAAELRDLRPRTSSHEVAAVQR
ncbi:glycine/D-amino acid oxidase-like deaminating enzyme [Motilibacter peucedani]|uniref:Glycine/D-amino acid oxidase-like deaminating enzyme n=1 Tax=Motilibacter peucedani TaxID=598650 RepID=A0A420XTA3_9ACTN|nr:FAD-binding oxidoreductase [Motilibacter peucedani]RKS79909.1 glycine/D-amino acid oxidase-like deaminating enzyme [Motilibacter peucedani]